MVFEVFNCLLTATSQRASLTLMLYIHDTASYEWCFSPAILMAAWNINDPVKQRQPDDDSPRGIESSSKRKKHFGIFKMSWSKTCFKEENTVLRILSSKNPQVIYFFVMSKFWTIWVLTPNSALMVTWNPVVSEPKIPEMASGGISSVLSPVGYISHQNLRQDLHAVSFLVQKYTLFPDSSLLTTGAIFSCLKSQCSPSQVLSTWYICATMPSALVLDRVEYRKSQVLMTHPQEGSSQARIRSGDVTPEFGQKQLHSQLAQIIWHNFNCSFTIAGNAKHTLSEAQNCPPNKTCLFLLLFWMEQMAGT